MYSNLPVDLLGNAIRGARLEKRLSQEELAELVGITPTHLKHIESGHRKPSVEILYRLVVTLQFSLDHLFLPEQAADSPLRAQARLLLGQCDDAELGVVLATTRALLDLRTWERADASLCGCEAKA